ncbi:MAG: hypothetical protein ACREEA_04405 [Stellaceae bacterium]
MTVRSFESGPSERKALLLRVGVDRGTGGVLGPIFPDGSFEYVPIPEKCPTNATYTYADLKTRDGGSLGRLLPIALAHRHPHLDPDFRTMTYGDAAPRKRAQLNRLMPGDLLVFYAGLSPEPAVDAPRLFAIGYLRVKRVYRLSARDIRGDRVLRRPFGETAHFKRRNPDRELALVEGTRSESRVFTHALPLGDARQCLLGDLVAFGYRGSLLRAVGHWIKGPGPMRALEIWLARGPAGLIGSETRLFRVDMSAIRPASASSGKGDLIISDRWLRAGDWIVSRLSASKADTLILARINRLVDRPGFNEGVSSLFWRFTGAAAIIAALHSDVETSIPRCTVEESPAVIRAIVSWMATRFRVGFHSK